MNYSAFVQRAVQLLMVLMTGLLLIASVLTIVFEKDPIPARANIIAFFFGLAFIYFLGHFFHTRRQPDVNSKHRSDRPVDAGGGSGDHGPERVSVSVGGHTVNWLFVPEEQAERTHSMLMICAGALYGKAQMHAAVKDHKHAEACMALASKVLDCAAEYSKAKRKKDRTL